MTEDERAIRDLVETWFVSSRRGDLATVLDLIADDAIFMVAGKPPFDKAAFAAASRDANAAAGNGPKVDGRYRIDELRVMGDWAYMRNFIEIDVTQPGGDAVRRSGHTLTIFRKSDGRWQLARDANLVMLAH
ncbi:YybH family protein [Burkholderia diffusa]|uniref:Ketosteroid isomerase n=2 Tax=Burkholderiaceae TaxID=119060 RepID=A0A6P2Q3X6_9BURK|nr:SgcJ/EcaC family oxidoreductase [Burkholderia diffusa]KAB0662141.1 SgcJ/EcaC family oxidoreductase [Burkholderia diffusa]MBM2655484.1 SgcJ/EcaC family oxidoreductase [Burkholderia diffusa]VWC14422.1 ketosteroid isomerase [Burkholderia diffusa]